MTAAAAAAAVRPRVSAFYVIAPGLQLTLPLPRLRKAKGVA